MKKTFYFDTGVRPETVSNPSFPYDYHREKGNVIRGTLQIPFECEDVPDGALFQFAAGPDCPTRNPKIKPFKIVGGNMLSEFAYFLLP